MRKKKTMRDILRDEGRKIIETNKKNRFNVRGYGYTMNGFVDDLRSRGVTVIRIKTIRKAQPGKLGVYEALIQR